MSRVWARVGFGRALSGGVAAVVAAPLLFVLARADGLPADRPQMSGGTAWLASPTRGAVTLIDGASEQVVGALRAPGFNAGDDLSVVQAGSSAYVISATAGTVSRVDGATYETSAPVRFGQGGSGAALQVYAGRSATYVVDDQRRTAYVVDPVTLAVRQQLALAGQPHEGQSVVDDAGRLWVVDSNGLAWFDGGGKHVRSDLAGNGLRLVLVGGQPELVDLGRGRVGKLTADGSVHSWSCLDVGASDQVQLIGSARLGRVLAANQSTGTLVMSGDGGDDCGQSLEVGRPGDTFGDLAQSGDFLFVPDQTSGRTAVIDLTSHQVVADLNVLKAGSRLELVAKDQLVFYNNLAGDEAGVLHLESGQWRVGKSLRKFTEGQNGGAKILSSGGSHAKQQQPRKGQGTPPPNHQPNNPPVNPSNGNNPPVNQPPVNGNPPPVNDPPVNQPPVNEPPVGGSPTPPTSPPPTGPTTSPPPGNATVTVHVTGNGFVTPDHPTPVNAAPGTQCGADSNCVYQYPLGTTAVLRVPNAPSADVILGTLDGCSDKTVSGTDTLCTIAVGGAVTITAAFVPKPPVMVTLAVTVAGSGSVTATPAGRTATACAPTCSVQVVAGTSVDLAAAAGAGSYLSSWGSAGCAVSTNSCAVSVAADTSLTVSFSPLLTLTVRAAGSAPGSVSGAGLSCGGGTCTGTFKAGDVVNLTATPGTNSVFTQWSGCSPATSANCSLTMSADATVTATFNTAIAVTVSALGQQASLDAGTTLNRSGDQTTVDMFLEVTTGFTIQSIEMDINYNVTCGNGHESQNNPSLFRVGASNGSGFPRVGFTLDMPGISCGGSFPTLERGGYAVTGKAVTDHGTFTTQAYVVQYTQ